MDPTRTQAVKSLQEIEGIYAEGTAHGHLAEGLGSDQLRGNVANLIAIFNGTSFSLGVGSKEDHWFAIQCDLARENLGLWVSLVQPVGISRWGEGETPPPPERTNIYKFELM